MSDWIELRIGDVANVKGGKRLPKGSTLTAAATPYPYIRLVDIDDGRINDRGLLFVPENIRPKISRYTINSDDIMISIVGTVGLVARIPARLSGANLTENAAKIVCDTTLVEADFLRYFLRSGEGQRRIAEQTVGSTQPKLALFRIADICYPSPPLSIQRAIASNLRALDDKIELNRRMNETLEAIARAIFKDWFVDFGPTRAKAEGRAPYLAAELWDLFPDAIDDDDKPWDWEVSRIGSEVEVVGGSTPSTKDATYWSDGRHYWATPKDLSKLEAPVLLKTDRMITDAGLRKISSGLLPAGTVLMSSRAPIGYLAIAEIPSAVNQGFIAMRCTGRLPNLFVWLWCEQNLDHIKGIAGGSTFAEISKKAFRPIPLVVPPEPVLAAFSELVEPIYKRIIENVKASETLAETRDLLLPKLISGEAQLSDAALEWRDQA